VSGTQQALIELGSPVLDEGGLAAIRTESGMQVAELDATFPVGATSVEAALDQLWHDAYTAVAAGAQLLIISDRRVDESRAPIPMLLALGAVHQRLIQEGLRTRVD